MATAAALKAGKILTKLFNWTWFWYIYNICIGFKSSLIVDYPDSTKARKMYLVLCAGDGDLSNIKPLTGDVDEEEKLSDDGDEKVKVIGK